ncbi:hypothetical protein AAHH78_33790, partial [Burkholderia pseudomallei]
EQHINKNDHQTLLQLKKRKKQPKHQAIAQNTDAQQYPLQQKYKSHKHNYKHERSAILPSTEIEDAKITQQPHQQR